MAGIDDINRYPVIHAWSATMVMRQMNLDDICPIVDTVTDLALYDKRGVLHDLAHRAAHTLNAVMILFSMLF